MEHDRGDGHKAWKVKLVEKKALSNKSGSAVSSGSSNASSTGTYYK